MIRLCAGLGGREGKLFVVDVCPGAIRDVKDASYIQTVVRQKVVGGILQMILTFVGKSSSGTIRKQETLYYSHGTKLQMERGVIHYV